MKKITKENKNKRSDLLSNDDINYMLSIVNSNLNDIEKATKLFSFCNYNTILKNAAAYGMYDLNRAKIVSKLLELYNDYDKKGYFSVARNPYKCNLEEINLRLTNLNKALVIVNSNISDYAKAEQLLGLYKSSEQLRKSYSLFLKFGKNDTRLSSGRKALDNFDKIFNTYKALEDKGFINNMKYIMSIKEYLKNYHRASSVICQYIKSSKSYSESEFLDEIGIDKEFFKYCVSTIQELNMSLYKKYEDKKYRNSKVRYTHSIITIKHLAQGIKTGILPDGTPFELLEFIKRIPFKYSENFMFTLSEFMKKNNTSEYNTIMTYIYKNKLNNASFFAPLDIKTLYKTKITINGIEITNQDNDIIIEYLKINNIPIINKTYILARTKYLNGEFTAETINKQQSTKNKVKEK